MDLIFSYISHDNQFTVENFELFHLYVIITFDWFSPTSDLACSYVSHRTLHNGNGDISQLLYVRVVQYYYVNNTLYRYL